MRDLLFAITNHCANQYSWATFCTLVHTGLLLCVFGAVFSSTEYNVLMHILDNVGFLSHNYQKTICFVSISGKGYSALRDHEPLRKVMLFGILFPPGNPFPQCPFEAAIARPTE